jgi:hypothetical protein
MFPGDDLGIPIACAANRTGCRGRFASSHTSVVWIGTYSEDAITQGEG